MSTVDQPRTPRNLPPLLPLPEAAQLLGIPRASAYRYAQAGTLPVKRFRQAGVRHHREAQRLVRAAGVCGVSGRVERYGKGWRYRFDLGPDPLTGQRRQASKGGFETKREAAAAMNEAIQANRTGRYVRRSARTVRDFLTEWLSSRATSLNPRHGRATGTTRNPMSNQSSEIPSSQI
ncbi:MAG: Arm DNA-binding domain-containing protein [Pseudonocardiaceae bacterium]